MTAMEARRRLLMMADELPGIYRRVEWIKSPGNTDTHIDTGIFVTQDIKFEIDFQYDGVVGGGAYFMGEYSGTSFYLYISTQQRFQTAFGATWSDTSLTADNNRHKFTYLFSTNGYLHVYDGETEILSKSFSTPSNKTIIVAGAVQSPIRSCKTFSSKLFENGVLIQNLIPCVRKSDDKPGMYDTVTKTFFTNSGTGEFIVPS